MCRNVVMNHVHPVSVVNSILPVFWLLPSNTEAKLFPSMYEGSLPPTISIRVGAKSMLLIIRSDLAPLVRTSRVADYERHSLRFFIHPSLVLQVVFAKHHTLVACIYDNGIFPESFLLEIVERRFRLSSTPFTQRRYDFR